VQTCAQILGGPVQGTITNGACSFWLLVEANSELSAKVTLNATGETHYIKPIKPDNRFCHKGACSYQFRVESLTEGEKYTLEIFTLDKVKTLQKQEFTVPFSHNNFDDFSFITGSCGFIATAGLVLLPPYRGIKIYDAMKREKAEFMLWLGDNLYYVKDTDAQRKVRRNIQYRKKRKLNGFLKSMPQMAIWDDHDYGPNDAKGDYMLKEASTMIFQQFWPNPPVVADNYYQFSQQDVDFFMLDVRSNSSAVYAANATILGEAQKQWLKMELKLSKATFKIIVTGQQFVSSHAHDNSFALYKNEKQELIDFFREEKIEGVVFLSGDRHYSEVSKAQLPELYPLYDFTCSPLTSWSNIKFLAKKENPEYRLPGSLFFKKTYAKLNFIGTDKNRKLVYELYDKKGQLFYTYILKANDLRF